MGIFKYLLNSTSKFRQLRREMILNVTNKGQGFLFTNDPNKTIIYAIGTWENHAKNYDLYLCKRIIRGETSIISPSEYQCGQVKFYWVGDDPIAHIKVYEYNYLYSNFRFSEILL